MKTPSQNNAPKDAKDRAAINRWLESQRGRPQYRSAPHAGRAVAKIMRPLARKNGAGSTGLAAHWQDIVGARFAKISRPLKFASGREGRTLVIAAPGPAAALIMASSTTIINRANGFLGPNQIRHIRVLQTKMKTEPTHTPAPRGLTQQDGDKLQSGLENVKDPDLKKALKSLGRNILSKPREN